MRKTKAWSDRNHYIFDADGTLYEPHMSPAQIYPEARPLLSELYERNTLSLLTTGAPYDQIKKINGDSLADSLLYFFRCIRVVTTVNDKFAALEDLVNSHSLSPRNRRRIIVIGDRPDVEIKAANFFNCTSVRVEQGKYADMKPADESEIATYTVRSLDEMGYFIERLDRIKR